MAGKPSGARQVLETLIAQFPDAPALTLAKQAYVKHPELWSNLEVCRTMVRTVLGVNGKFDRKHSANKSHFRPPRSPGDWSKRIPKALCQLPNWGSVNIDGPVRALVLADVHVPFHEERVLRIALEYGIKHEANLILLNGDFVDHHWGSDFVKDPRFRDFKTELKAAKKLLRGIRKTFPKARMIYKWGNHEERYERYMLIKAPELIGIEEFEFENVFGLKETGVELIKDKRPIRLGSLNVLHGHEYRFQISNPVNPARGLYLKAKAHGLIGHFHQTSQHSEKNVESKVVSTWSTGCLCDLHPAYSPINNWNSGFAFVAVDADGNFHVDNLRVIDGAIY